MNNKIRTRTNEIYSKISKSLKKQPTTLDDSKLVDRRLESRYHTPEKIKSIIQ